MQLISEEYPQGLNMKRTEYFWHIQLGRLNEDFQAKMSYGMTTSIFS